MRRAGFRGRGEPWPWQPTLRPPEMKPWAQGNIVPVVMMFSSSKMRPCVGLEGRARRIDGPDRAVEKRFVKVAHHFVVVLSALA